MLKCFYVISYMTDTEHPTCMLDNIFTFFYQTVILQIQILYDDHIQNSKFYIMATSAVSQVQPKNLKNMSESIKSDYILYLIS